MSRNKPQKQMANAFNGAKTKESSTKEEAATGKSESTDTECKETMALLRKYLIANTKEELPYGYDLNSPAVTTHLAIVAEIINRLATNSNYCKTICVAIVTVFATFSATPKWPDLGVWCIPVFAIALLDSLFVFLKKRLTKEQEVFVSQFIPKDKHGMLRAVKKDFCLKSEGEWSDIYMFPFVASSASKWETFKGMFRNLFDISVGLFYGPMIITLVVFVWFKSKGLL